MSSKSEQGEVWLADVLFKGTRQSKQRPVVIVGNELALDIDVIIAPVTSQKLRNQFDIVLEYWEEAGLLKPSVVHTSKITSIHGTELKRYLGKLHNHDLENAVKVGFMRATEVTVNNFDNSYNQHTHVLLGVELRIG